MYDVSSRASFEALDYWLEEMSGEVTSKAEADSITICVCANKVR